MPNNRSSLNASRRSDIDPTESGHLGLTPNTGSVGDSRRGILPDGVTPDMLAALQRGEDVRLSDGRRVTPRAGARSALGSLGTLGGLMVEPEDDVLPSIRLSPDYSAPSPLWPSSDGTDAMVPEELLARLVRWQRDLRSELPLGNRLEVGRGQGTMGRPGC